MGNLRLGRYHRGLGVVIVMHKLLNIRLVGYRGKLTVLNLFLGLAGSHFFKPNPRIGIVNTCLGNLRLLIGISLGVL